MKVVKLDRRHHLFHKGYVYAFKFNGWKESRTTILNLIEKMERTNKWHNTYWGKPVVDPDNRDYRMHPCWVGVKKESTVTAVLLSLK